MKKLIVILLPFLLAGCSSNTNTSGSSYYAKDSDMYDAATAYATEEYAVENDSVSYSASYDSGGSNQAQISTVETGDTLLKSEEKIVYTGNLNVETTDYEKTLQALADLEQQFGIVVTSSDESIAYNDRHYMYMTLRVPSARFHEFMSGTSVLGNIRSQSINRSDITKAYNDRSIEAEALKIQQARLQEMLAEAETVTDMLAIEDRLIEVETELNKLNSTLANMDMDVTWSTVYININEVVQYSPGTTVRKDETFLDRLTNAFQDSLKITGNFLETVLFTLIRYLPVIVILFLLYQAYRKYRQKHPRTDTKPLFFRKRRNKNTSDTQE